MAAANPQALSARQAARVQAALGFIKGGDVAAALAAARQLVAEAPQAPDAQQLLAMCHAESGDLDSAAHAFDRALQLAPRHPAILLNQARVLRRLGRLPEAIGSLQTVVQLQPTSSLAWHALAQAQRDDGQLEAAEASLRSLLDLTPTDGSAWGQLAVVLRLLGRPEESVGCFQRAGQEGFASAELADGLSGALIDNGLPEAALAQARHVNATYPEFVGGHVTLANLLWEHGDPAQGEPAAVFERALQQRPQDPYLRLAFARFLLSAQRAELALEHISTLRRLADQPSLVAMHANALQILGRSGEAGPLYRQAHAGFRRPEAGFLNAYARHLLTAGDYAAAADIAGEATRADPLNQESWAYLGTAWRLLGDPREMWLFQYDRLIGSVEVEPPEGFPDMPTFLDVLQSTLLPLHQARREPLQQSLRNGSQTPGRLFGRRDPVIAAAQLRLRQAVVRWIDTLPDDPAHPFLMRKQPGVRFGGSWSVRLWTSGKHVNHVHPEGWMSSAFYVALPPSLAAAAAAHDFAGCIQFGQAPVELGLDLPPRRVIRPKAGQLALFPSYMWHGTVPFDDLEPRLSLAFDMTPDESAAVASADAGTDLKTSAADPGTAH